MSAATTGDRTVRGLPAPLLVGGAFALSTVALVSLPFFWSGAPAVPGASAAWLAGLAKGGHPQSGAARAFGVIGFVIAILCVVAVLAGSVLNGIG